MRDPGNEVAIASEIGQKHEIINVMDSQLLGQCYDEILDCKQSLFSSKFRGEKRKTSNRAIEPFSCFERDVRTAMPRGAYTTSGSRHCRSHITLTVTLAHSFVSRSSPRFSRKRETARSLTKFMINHRLDA